MQPFPTQSCEPVCDKRVFAMRFSQFFTDTLSEISPDTVIIDLANTVTDWAPTSYANTVIAANATTTQLFGIGVRFDASTASFGAWDLFVIDVDNPKTAPHVIGTIFESPFNQFPSCAYFRASDNTLFLTYPSGVDEFSLATVDVSTAKPTTLGVIPVNVAGVVRGVFGASTSNGTLLVSDPNPGEGWTVLELTPSLALGEKLTIEENGAMSLDPCTSNVMVALFTDGVQPLKTVSITTRMVLSDVSLGQGAVTSLAILPTRYACECQSCNV